MSINSLTQVNQEATQELVELNTDDLNGVVGGCHSHHHKHKNKKHHNHNKHQHHAQQTNQATNPNLAPSNQQTYTQGV